MPAAPAMRARADAGVIPVAPVSEVVAALLARPGVVGDFIGGEARRRGPLLGQLEQVAARVGVERLELMPARTIVAKRVPGSIVSW